jgi:hypothetical protein
LLEGLSYVLFIQKKSLQNFFISSPVSIGAGSSTFVPLSPRVALILNKLIEIRGALVSEELLLAVAPSVRPKRTSSSKMYPPLELLDVHFSCSFDRFAQEQLDILDCYSG